MKLFEGFHPGYLDEAPGMVERIVTRTSDLAFSALEKAIKLAEPFVDHEKYERYIDDSPFNGLNKK